MTFAPYTLCGLVHIVLKINRTEGVRVTIRRLPCVYLVLIT